MKKLLRSVVLGLGLLTSFAAIAATQPLPPPGVFDNFVLAMSYQNDFCATHPGSNECRWVNRPRGMALHGLWPNRYNDPKNQYAYCSISQRQLGPNYWCNPKWDVRNQMTAAEFSALGAVLPGVASCLYNHEWYTHGTCSGLTVGNYFADAIVLAERFQSLPNFNQFIRINAGKIVSPAQILGALERDIGTNVLPAIRFVCRPGLNGAPQSFMELDLGLNRLSFMSFPQTQSFAALKAGVGCANAPVAIAP